MTFFPKNPKFFDLFENLAEIVNSSGKILVKLKISANNVKTYSKKAWELEQAADEICHKLHHEAESTFITPIDREDIHLLARHLDNIVDLIEDLTSKIVLYKITREISQYQDFTLKIKNATEKIFALIGFLKYRDKHIPEMRKLIIKIHSLENEGDTLIRSAIKYLFANHKSHLIIIKWKDIFENLEEILDECEDTADIVEGIIVKNF